MSCRIEKTTPIKDDEKAPSVELPEGVPPLSSLYIYASDSCNLSCQHCWIVPTVQTETSAGSFIKLEYVQKAINEGKPLGLNSVKLTGGEPTIHPRFRELVSLIEKEKLFMNMESNGVLIDEELARFLKGNSFFSFVSVSLDGAKSSTHDRMRGLSGSFEQAKNGLKNLVNVGFKPQVICTLHRGNLAEMNDLIDLAEKMGCGSVKFNHVQQIGRGKSFSRSHGLGIDEIIKLNRHLESDIIPKRKIRIIFDIPIAFFPIRKFLNDPVGRCAIKNVIGLLSGGELALCGIGTTVQDLIFGHIETDDLEKIWRENPKLKRLREQIPGQLEGVCAKCIHQSMCQGACVANNFLKTGRLNAAYFFCQISDELGLFPSKRKKV